jgi:hypothetical protein
MSPKRSGQPVHPTVLADAHNPPPLETAEKRAPARTTPCNLPDNRVDRRIAGCQRRWSYYVFRRGIRMLLASGNQPIESEIGLGVVLAPLPSGFISDQSSW